MKYALYSHWIKKKKVKEIKKRGIERQKQEKKKGRERESKK